MPVDAKIRDILRMENLTLPPEARVQSIEVEDYVDYVGDEALRVWVVVDENFTNAELLNNGAAWNKVTEEVHRNLRKNNVTLFPYFHFVSPSDRTPDGEMVVEDEDEE